MADDKADANNAPTSTRRLLLAGGAAACALAAIPASQLIARAAKPRMLRGVALAGAEFGQLVPGLHGRDYSYPGVTDFQFCASQGFNVVRLPFKWDRLQPDLTADFDHDEWARINGAIETAQRLQLSIILDPHNYAQRRIRADNFTNDHLIGSQSVPGDAFVQFWRELASRTKSHGHVIFGMMNEPAGLDARPWLEIANATLAAVRSTGARQIILVPGVAYTGAHSWHAAGNTILDQLRDPAENFAIEVHQYLDSDSSGRSGTAVSETIGPERIQAFETWARGHGFKAFLGEFGAGQDADSLKAMKALLNAVERSPDVWIGWTAWAAGPWWPDDEPLRLSASKSGDIPPQTRALSRFARNQK